MDNLPSILFPLRMVQLDLYPDWHHPGADLVEFKSSDFSSVERRRTYDARAATSNGFAFEPQNSTTLLLGGTQGALFKGLATIGIKNISDPDYDSTKDHRIYVEVNKSMVSGFPNIGNIDFPARLVLLAAGRWGSPASPQGITRLAPGAFHCWHGAQEDSQELFFTHALLKPYETKLFDGLTVCLGHLVKREEEGNLSRKIMLLTTTSLVGDLMSAQEAANAIDVPVGSLVSQVDSLPAVTELMKWAQSPEFSPDTIQKVNVKGKSTEFLCFKSLPAATKVSNAKPSNITTLLASNTDTKNKKTSLGMSRTQRASCRTRKPRATRTNSTPGTNMYDLSGDNDYDPLPYSSTPDVTDMNKRPLERNDTLTEAAAIKRVKSQPDTSVALWLAVKSANEKTAMAEKHSTENSAFFKSTMNMVLQMQHNQQQQQSRQQIFFAQQQFAMQQLNLAGPAGAGALQNPFAAGVPQSVAGPVQFQFSGGPAAPLQEVAGQTEEMDLETS